MIPQPVLNLALGSLGKMAWGLVSAKIARDNLQQKLNNAQQTAALEAQARLVEENAKDPFVQVTRRQLFQALILGFLWVCFYFGMDPAVDWTMHASAESGRVLSLWERLLTGADGKMVHVAVVVIGGLVEIIPMIIGFFVTPSPKK